MPPPTDSSIGGRYNSPEEGSSLVLVNGGVSDNLGDADRSGTVAFKMDVIEDLRCGMGSGGEEGVNRRVFVVVLLVSLKSAGESTLGSFRALDGRSAPVADDDEASQDRFLPNLVK